MCFTKSFLKDRHPSSSSSSSQTTTYPTGISALLVSSATNLAFPTILARVIDLASGVRPADKTTVHRFLLGALGVFSLGATASWTRVYCFGVSNERIASHFRKRWPSPLSCLFFSFSSFTSRF